MAKRKDEDGARKGRAIPIEDAASEEGAAGADEAAGAAGAAGAAKAAEVTEAAGAAKAAGAARTAKAAGAAGAAKATEAAGADEAAAGGTVEDGSVDGEAAVEDAEGDLVAEAEAIVEEAAGEVSAAEQLEAARRDASEWQDRYLRLHAEWDTYRRRMGEQRAEERARATEKLMEDLLPVLDDFERSVAYAEENGETGLLDGVKAIQSKLADALSKGGLEVIDPAGEPYDALEAQAVQMVPDEEAFEETVHEVYQKGYKMGKKVLRPAMVTVTTGGPKRPKEEPES